MHTQKGAKTSKYGQKYNPSATRDIIRVIKFRPYSCKCIDICEFKYLVKINVSELVHLGIEKRTLSVTLRSLGQFKCTLGPLSTKCEYCFFLSP